MSWNIKTPGDYINGPLTVAGAATFNSNIGMSATPSAWGSGFRAIEFPFGTSFFVNSFVANPNIGANFYIDSAVKNIYKGNGAATSYSQYNGAHSWFTAAAGVAGAEITEFASAKMTLSQPGLLTLTRATAGVGLEVYNSTTYSQIRLQSSGTNQSSYLTFNPTGTGRAVIQMNNIDRLFLDTNGNLGFLSGRGIDFSSDSNAAGMTSEILNDYEEGTWTGTLKGSVSDPTTPVTATGRYTKIGRQVFVHIGFDNFSNAGASGHITVAGLPFNSAGSPCIGIPFMNKVGTYTGTPFMYLNGTVIELYAMTSGAQETLITHNVGTGRYMILTITYTV